ncbi:YfdY family protein [Citrobacter sp. Cm046]|uniref:YfdY family protein n=1 Tax=Citrobacter sp. Cm046 TaxID=2985118 RepID=UPI002575956D|nr:YfdY family protein [Citrobacter sp. Cm046]MDM2930560.1 YfdY family protein [Citrobacter sp. Cm046]
MFYFWTFLSLSILGVGCYIWQVMGAVASISSFFGMAILTTIIYFFTMWLTNGDEMVTGLFLFLAPACGLIIRFMVGDGKH